MRTAVFGLAMLMLPEGIVAQEAPAQTVPGASRGAQGDVSVTIYNNDVALVQDVRQLPIARGQVRQDFPDVSASIRPETVSLNIADAGIVEQNFDYDLLSPSSLMEKAVGETITLLRTNPATGAETRERARVLAVNGGAVLQIGERIEVLRDDGLPVRAIFDRVPASLRARPTLSVMLDSNRAGTRPATLAYLSRGLGWSAYYVALFDDRSGRIDVQGWVTLKNTAARPSTMRARCWSRGRWRPKMARAIATAIARVREAGSNGQAPKRRRVSNWAISTSIRCLAGRRSPTSRPSR